MESKKKLRAHDALDILIKGGNATFFTFTTPDEVDFKEISARWRRFRTWFLQYLRRGGSKPQYVMNFERHPGYLQKVVKRDTFDEFVVRSDGNSHGWHIHGVISCRFPMQHCFLKRLARFGFGRVDVRKVNSHGVAEYLTKHALKAYRGISRREKEKTGVQRLRLVCASRGLPALHDYRANSPHLEKARYIMALQVAEVKRAGHKLANAIAIWKKAECLALMYGTPFYESLPRSGAAVRGGSRSLRTELTGEQSRRGCFTIRDGAKSEGRERPAAPLGALTKIPLPNIPQIAAVTSTVSS